MIFGRSNPPHPIRREIYDRRDNALLMRWLLRVLAVAVIVSVGAIALWGRP